MKITLKYKEPQFPKLGFMFYELVERFMKDKRYDDELRLLRMHLKALYTAGNVDDLKDLTETRLKLNQKKGIVEVL